MIEKLPSFPRFFTDLKLKLEIFKAKLNQAKFLIALIICLILFFAIIVQSIRFYSNFKKEKELRLKKEQVLNKINIWQSIVSKYPNYRDGYFKLSLLEYQIGEFDKSRMYLDQTLFLDPNFEEGIKFDRSLPQ